ncbi:glycosyltransferase family 2 protein [Nocardioides daphniae]|uniref:glycosyltransferase family 2 protein n=1 Tax=Nocardioides daphniae TaxID=402297 RepID=UPI0013153895|nr:glycosyltransferase family 2 protein [Nocardioides daphniae]
MIVTVSTVKDHLSNVQRFVEGNLDGGVDHMVVFLARAPKVKAWLDTRPEVTAVVTDDTWWRGQRPALLNRRQNANANLVRHVLADLGWAEWLFHVDADEVLQLDRDELAGVPAREPAVSVPPLEVVSIAEPDGPPVLFKRLLDDGELHLVTALGLLAEPTNSRYFRSHIAGKVGIRPGADVWLGIHKATDPGGRRLPLVQRPGVEMLHYEAFSARTSCASGWRWSAPAPASTSARTGWPWPPPCAPWSAWSSTRRPGRATWRGSTTLHMADPVDDLAALGLLESRPPLSHGHRPQVLDESRRSALAAAVEGLRTQDKKRFVPPKDPAKGETAPSAAGAGLTEKVRRRMRRQG